MADAWEKKGRGDNARLVPEEFVLHSGGIWRRNEVGRDRGESTGDTAGREVVVQRIYGVRGG